MTDKAPVEVRLDPNQLKEIIGVFSSFVKVYAASQLRHDQATDKKARFLKVFGFRNSEIADLLGVSDQAIDQALTRTKKSRKNE